ncbi:MAG: hypothetical protein GY821_08535 [Gammaproteobacteria bacterium]|nr:hypothetical protein [Gammaproteobacteria bacterium]
MKQFVAIMIGFILSGIVSIGFGENEMKIVGQYSPSHAPFLYVTEAKQGQMQKDSQGGYILTIHKMDIHHVLMFSQQPFELKRYIIAAAIRKNWHIGKGHFPSNQAMQAVILSNQQVLSQVRVTAIEKTATNMKFYFLTNHVALKPSTLVDVVIINYCCQARGGTSQWLWGDDIGAGCHYKDDHTVCVDQHNLFQSTAAR